MNRTGSMASRVPPAVTSTRRPRRSPSRLARKPSMKALMSSGSGSRPDPLIPQARWPAALGMMVIPSWRRVARFRTTAGFSSMLVFMAGHTILGRSQAITSHQRPMATCSTLNSAFPAHRSVATGLPLISLNSRGETRWVAASVMITRTWAPAWTSRLTRVTAL